jgi:hypothetical protein
MQKFSGLMQPSGCEHVIGAQSMMLSREVAVERTHEISGLGAFLATTVGIASVLAFAIWLIEPSKQAGHYAAGGTNMSVVANTMP